MIGLLTINCEEKTESILFSSKHKVKKCKPLNIHYKNIKIKQYSKVTYLGCILDENSQVNPWQYML